ncbi:hypothetical protein NE237_028672 [Protea cynaroides]|uniref:Zinc finger PHD-type domain-containing protein n=1 Tax=Protea cynaroides TaxID=273540 RepID=A0A9Q0GQS5_9MAGN|nr:hypothetical protein NE237_028672 [Protea cynaroides]
MDGAPKKMEFTPHQFLIGNLVVFAMARRRERPLRELYGVTDLLMQPEVTPVLKGSCRMQGPLDEGELDIQTNTRSSRAEKRFSRHFPSENVQMKVESGTCNVCSAPCSSCMHFNRATSFMASKIEDEFSDGTCRGKAASRCSFNDAGMLPSFKSRTCIDQQPTASETSNLLSASSSHDSFSQNAESKMALRTSDASEDVEMQPKLSSGGMNGQDKVISKTLNVQRDVISASSHTASNMDQTTFSNQYQEQKGFDCNGDNGSCVSGANFADVPNDNHNVDMDRKNVSCSSASVCSFHPGGVEKKVNIDTASGCLIDFPFEMEERRNNSRISDAKDLEENSCSHLRGPSECSMEHVESSLDRVVVSDGVVGEKTTAFNSADISLKVENSIPSLVRNAASASMKVYPCLEAEGATDSEDPETEAVKCAEQRRKFEKSHASPEVADTHDPPVQSQPIDESDGSDIVEDDVKVCDICGDAGREEMLAFCCRCSDGAEHSYCMRIMLNKVPEGDWLCEECKLKEEAEKPKQDKLETVSDTSKTSCLNEKDQSLGAGAFSSRLIPKLDVREAKLDARLIPKLDVKEAKLDVKDTDVEGTKSSSTHLLPAKCQSDNVEVASAAKRQALETSVGSLMASSPGRKAVLSRESSFKNLDKGKVKPSQQMPLSGNLIANNSQETADSSTASGYQSSRIQSRLQSPRGTLLKSNSFSTSSAKPKVKLMQEDVPSKQKLAKEVPANETKKDGIVKTISKSMSFKSTLTGRSNATEAKVKMLPSNFNRTEDLRGIKQAKERNLVERKSSFKLDRPLGSSATALSSVSNTKSDLKTPPLAETTPLLSSATSYRDLKAVQPDGKLIASGKPISPPGNRGEESPNALAGSGEGKRQTSSSASVLGSPSSNGRGTSVELKPRQVIPREEPVSCSTWNGDKFGSKPDAIMPEGFPLSRESTNQEGRTREPPVSHSRPVGGQKVRCNKCKEVGHAEQSCPVGSPRVSVLEISSPKSLREVTSKSNKLKAAIEAAILKKPRLYKNNKTRDQSDELSMSSTELSCEAVPRDQFSTSSSCLRNLNSGEGTNDGLELIKSPAVDLSKITSVDDVKQHFVPLKGALSLSKAAELDAATTSIGNKIKPFVKEFHSRASAGVAPSQFSAIPEHNYIWHGGFEVQRSGMLPELCDGIQAHLSTRASPKVIEVVNKFPSEVQMEEVPRLSTWPVQFQEHPVADDNIALYFFAKDLESYDRSYKRLLNKMIKNDLALKGKFDGIELLVFPSSQLAEKSQRWNMLFFLWGVFRGKRVNCLECLPDCEKKFSQASSDAIPLDQDSSDRVIPVSHINRSSGQMDESLSSCNRSSGEQKAAKSTVSLEFPFSGVDLNCEAKVSSPEMESLDFKTKFEENDSGLSTTLSSRVQSDFQCTAVKSNGSLLVEHIDLESKPELERQPEQLNRENGSFNKGKMVSTGHTQWDSPIEEHDTLSPSKMLLVDTSLAQGVDARKTGHEKMQEVINNRSRDQVGFQNKVKDEGMVDMVEKECISLVSISKKRPYSDLEQMVSPASGEASTARSQAIPLKEKTECVMVDGESDSKKMKWCFREPFVCSSSKGQSSSGDSFASHIYGQKPGFPVKEQKYDGAYEDVIIPENLRDIERHFFPMDFGLVKDHRLESSSVPLKGLSPVDEDRLGSEVPNLELALGPKQGRLALFGRTISEKNNNNKLLEPLTEKKEDDNGDTTASLALSLAFPFSEKERIGRPVSRTEQLLPERHQVNTSWLLFGGLSDT